MASVCGGGGVAAKGGSCARVCGASRRCEDVCQTCGAINLTGFAEAFLTISEETCPPAPLALSTLGPVPHSTAERWSRRQDGECPRLLNGEHGPAYEDFVEFVRGSLYRSKRVVLAVWYALTHLEPCRVGVGDHRRGQLSSTTLLTCCYMWLHF